MGHLAGNTLPGRGGYDDGRLQIYIIKMQFARGPSSSSK